MGGVVGWSLIERAWFVDGWGAEEYPTVQGRVIVNGILK